MYTIWEAIVSIIITVNTNINNIPVVIRQNVWSLLNNETDCCVNDLYFLLTFHSLENHNFEIKYQKIDNLNRNFTQQVNCTNEQCYQLTPTNESIQIKSYVIISRKCLHDQHI